VIRKFAVPLASVALLAGCGHAPTSLVNAAQQADSQSQALVADLFAAAPAAQTPSASKVSVTVQLAAPTDGDFDTQAIVHRWVVADVFQYDVTLKVWDAKANAYVDFKDGFGRPQPLTVVAQQKGASKQDKAVFKGLSQGKKYRAFVVAKGNKGGTAPETVLNAKTSTTADFDFTAKQDVEDTLTEKTKIVFDSVAFSGNAGVVIETPDEGTYSNPTARPTGAAEATKAPLKITTHVGINMWGWDIIGTSVNNLDLSPVLCNDGKYHVPNTFEARPLDGTLNIHAIHAAYPNWYDGHGNGNFEWWMYHGQWAWFHVTRVGVWAEYNDGHGVIGYGPMQGTATFGPAML
jgi:hypothetical protein